MPAPLRTLLVDDELTCCEALRIFLSTKCPEVSVIGEAHSLAEATEKLSKTAPDLVLLDVDLGDGTGFDLLDRFPKPGFRVIFTTAYDEFAFRAFRYSALDYLLKPVDPDDLVAAVQRASIPHASSVYHRQLEQLHQQVNLRQFDRITLNTGDGLLFIGTEEIIRLEAQGNYSFVFQENGDRHLIAQSLAAFEEMLPTPLFFRAHQSHIVNTKFVRKMVRDDGDNIIMNDKAVIPLARRRKEAFVEIMKIIGQG